MTVTCKSVSAKRGGVEVLHDIDLVVSAGTWVSLVGPNGSGKTTLLHSIAGLVAATGDITVAGVTPRKSGRRAVALVHALFESQVAGRPVTLAEVETGAVDAYQREIDEHYGLV